MKKNTEILSVRRLMVLLFLLATVSVSLAVGLISWQQQHYSSLRIASLGFHPQSITNISDANENLGHFKTWVVKATNKQGEILLNKRRILGKHPLAILALLKQHILLLDQRQLSKKIEKYNRVSIAAQNHLQMLTQLITFNTPDKIILAVNVNKLIRSFSLDLMQWRKMHEMDFIQDEAIFNEFKEQINQLFYATLIILIIVSIPLGIVFVRRLNETLHQIEITQEQLSELNQTLETRVEKRTNELSKLQASLVRNERLAALGQLTGTVSHELRNPLGTITTSLFTLRNKLEAHNIDVDKTLNRIDRNIKRCDNIVEDLLQYSRIQALHFESLDFKAWLKDIVDDYNQLENLTIHCKIDDVESIEFDPHRLRRVFINLFGNAVRAMSINNQLNEGSILWVKVVPDRLGVRISITDNGAGVPENKVNHIFEPLFSTHAFGVGLGLPIVRQIMEQHNGTINLDKNSKKGACFHCYLPLRQKKDQL